MINIILDNINAIIFILLVLYLCLFGLFLYFSIKDFIKSEDYLIPKTFVPHLFYLASSY
jgi:Ca2+/Na+ antiporter